MSRFNNLELNQAPQEPERRRPLVKDEAFYLEEARREFAGGRFEQALRHFSKVLEFNPDNAAAWTGQVRMLIELGEFPEARLWAEKALERFPREGELLAAKAVALGRLGELDAAMAFSDAAMEVPGGTAYTWLARGDVLLARREQRAEYCFEKAFGLAPTDWLIRWLAARIYAYYEAFALGLKHAQQALTLEAGNPAVWLEVGRCQMAVGLAGLARQSFQQAVQLNPGCRDVAAGLEATHRPGILGRLRNAWSQLFPRT